LKNIASEMSGLIMLAVSINIVCFAKL
jgi:hypothetical protein